MGLMIKYIEFLNAWQAAEVINFKDVYAVRLKSVTTSVVRLFNLGKYPAVWSRQQGTSLFRIFLFPQTCSRRSIILIVYWDKREQAQLVKLLKGGVNHGVDRITS